MFITRVLPDLDGTWTVTGHQRCWPVTVILNHKATAQCTESCLGLVEPRTPCRRELVPKAEEVAALPRGQSRPPCQVATFGQGKQQAGERPRAKTQPRRTTSRLRRAFCSIIRTVRRNLPDEPPGVFEHEAELPYQASAGLGHHPLGFQQPGPASPERVLLTAGQFARHLGAPLRNARERFHEIGDPLPVSNVDRAGSRPSRTEFKPSVIRPGQRDGGFLRRIATLHRHAQSRRPNHPDRSRWLPLR